jgi:hypothetical protein
MMEQLTTLVVARLTNVFQLILRSPLVQSWLVEKIEKNVKGPDAAKTQRKPDMGVGRSTRRPWTAA